MAGLKNNPINYNRTQSCCNYCAVNQPHNFQTLAKEIYTKIDLLTMWGGGTDGYLDRDWERLLILTSACMESIAKDANLVTASAISSSDLHILDLFISGAKLTDILACSLANLMPPSKSPWYRTEANAHTTRASWGLFTNARWNASNPILSHIKM